jgi:hypothetical protein
MLYLTPFWVSRVDALETATGEVVNREAGAMPARTRHGKQLNLSSRSHWRL